MGTSVKRLREDSLFKVLFKQFLAFSTSVRFSFDLKLNDLHLFVKSFSQLPIFYYPLLHYIEWVIFATLNTYIKPLVFFHKPCTLIKYAEHAF